jgi:hypothetical protein
MTSLESLRMKIACLTMIMLMVIPGVLALSDIPVQTNPLGSSTWDVESSVIGIAQQNLSREISVHVYNGSTGWPIVSDASCDFHVYDSQGNHIAEGSDGMVSHTFDYSYVLNENNFSKQGEYSYVVQCNSTDQGGYVAGVFEVTGDGQQRAGDVMIIFLYMIFMALTFGLVFLFLINMAKMVTATTTIFDLATSWGIYFVTLIALYLSQGKLMDPFIPNNITLYITITSLTAIVLPGLGLAYTMIYQAFVKKRPLSMNEIYGRRIV